MTSSTEDSRAAQLLAARDLERHARLAQRALGAHDALRDGGARAPGRRARSRSVVSPPSRRSVSAVRASVDSTGWQAMKISRSRSSPISSSAAASGRVPTVLPGPSRARRSVLRACWSACAGAAGDRVARLLGGGHQPGAGIVRDAAARPLLERASPAHPARAPRPRPTSRTRRASARDQPRRLDAPDRLDRAMDIRGRHGHG